MTFWKNVIFLRQALLERNINFPGNLYVRLCVFQARTCSAVGLRALFMEDSSVPRPCWITSSTLTCSSSRRSWRGGKPGRWPSWPRRSCSEGGSLLPLQDYGWTAQAWCSRTLAGCGKHPCRVWFITLPNLHIKPTVHELCPVWTELW